MDNFKKLNKKKTVRERFPNLSDEEFIKNCNKRIANAKRLITRDEKILAGEGTFRGRKINVTTPKYYEERIVRNKKVLDTWQDAVKESHFKTIIKKQLKNVFTSNFKEPYIEETLFTSKYILDITYGGFIDYEIKNGEPVKGHSYYIKAYENEKKLDEGEEYNGGGLVIIPEEEKYTEELINKKYEYIISFI